MSYASSFVQRRHVGAGWVTLTPAMATSIGLTGFNGLTPSATPIEKVGYWKRQYRRHGYPAPYAYYPPRTAIIRLP